MWKFTINHQKNLKATQHQLALRKLTATHSRLGNTLDMIFQS